MKILYLLAAIIIVLAIMTIMVACMKYKSKTSDFNPIYYTLVICISWIALIFTLIASAMH